MNTDRTVILENVGGFPVGLVDTQGRTYSLGKSMKMRVSAMVLQDILDYPPSRIILNDGLIKISNITRAELYNMGLTEEDINLYLKEEKKVEIKEESAVKENKEEKKEAKPAVKKAAPKKTTTKKAQ